MANLSPFQIIIFVVFGVSAIAGLLFFANFKGFGTSAEEVGAVTIWGTLPQSQMSASLNEMKRLHKEYGKVSYVEKPAATFDADLANAIASGTGPDLILISHEHLIAERSRLTIIPFSTISERAFRDAYLPIFEVYLADNGTYGIPLVADPLVMYYNRTLLATVGASQAPKTWEAVIGLAPTITQYSESQSVRRSAAALGTYHNIENARGIISLLFFQAGQKITEETAQGIRSTIARAGNETYGATPIESALGFYTEFANPTKTTYSWNRSFPSARQSFTVGDLALYFGYASEAAALAAANPNLDFDMAPVPQPGTATVRATYGKAYAFSIPRASRNASGAYLVARAMGAADTLPALARGLGMAPGTRSMLAPSRESIYEPVYYPEALVAKAWLSPAPATTDIIFASMIDNVNSGRMSVRQAIVTADQALSTAFFSQ